MRFSFRNRSPIPELHVDRDAAEPEPLDCSGAVSSEASGGNPAFVDEAAEMERVNRGADAPLLQVTLGHRADCRKEAAVGHRQTPHSVSVAVSALSKEVERRARTASQ
jgi:hypothetical protein